MNCRINIAEGGDTKYVEKPVPLESNITCLCSQRWIIGYLGFAFGAVFSIYRINMSMAIVCMVKDDVLDNGILANTSYGLTNNASTLAPSLKDNTFNFNGGCEGEIVHQHSGNNGEFTWDKKTQSVVLSAFFYGFVTSQIPAGWIIVRFGGKNVITTTISLASLCMVLLPALARFHVVGLIIARIMTGVVLGPLPSAWFTLLGRWALPNERSRMMMMFWIGQTVGTVAGIATSGLLCVHGFDNGWGSIFYIHGALGFAFVAFWLCLAADSPNTHPRISASEKEMIAKHLNTSTTTNDKITKVPWHKICTSLAVWSILLTELCDNWSYYLMLTCLPMFVNEILKFDIQSQYLIYIVLVSAIIHFAGSPILHTILSEPLSNSDTERILNGFYSTLPFIATLLSLLCSGVVCDYVIKKGWTSRTCNRKIFQITALVGSAVFLVVSSYLPCDRKHLVIVCISMCTFFLYLGYASGYPCNLVDMTPRYASFIYGVANTLGATTGFLAPLAVGLLTKHKTIDEWRLVFWISAGIACIGAIIYGLFSSSELLDWDQAYTITIDIEPPNKTYGGSIKRNGQTSIEMDGKGSVGTDPLLRDGTSGGEFEVL